MALTNLANGRDALKGVLLHGGAVGAAGAALARWGLAGGRSVGMQVMSLFVGPLADSSLCPSQSGLLIKHI